MLDPHDDWGVSPVIMFASIMMLNVIRWLLSRRKFGYVQQHKVRLAHEIAALRRQAEAFNNPATYVKCAKFQRLANAKEKEMMALESPSSMSLQDRMDAAVAAVKLAFMAGVVLSCWGRALMYVPPQLTWPIGGLLSFPHVGASLGSGAVTVIPWLALCDRVSSLVARVAFPQPMLALRTQPLASVAEDAEY